MNSSTSYWGLLGTETIGSLRRSRTLELGAVVRKFNNLAVPGMGGVRFAKQIYLVTLGLAVAEKARIEKQKVKNIEMANAIEAIACLLSYENNGWEKDPRLKGSNKLKGVFDISFSKVRKPNFYITQPMRMGAVQALPALGLVSTDTIRFNSFRLTEEGKMLVDRISDQYPKIYRQNDVIDYLILWVNNAIPVKSISENNQLRLLLSPLEKLDANSRGLLRKFILNGSSDAAARRKAVFAWMDMKYLHNKGHHAWNKRPSCIDEAHWKDLHAGALFFKTREIALELLDDIEVVISRKNGGSLSLLQAKRDLRNKQIELSKAAQMFLQLIYDPSPEKQATVFCLECVDVENCIAALVKRDGVGLKLKGEKITPGPAFKGDKLTEQQEVDDDEIGSFRKGMVRLPNNISTRVYNMFYLNQDLKGTINKWL